MSILIMHLGVNNFSIIWELTAKSELIDLTCCMTIFILMIPPLLPNMSSSVYHLPHLDLKEVATDCQ